MKGHPVGVVGSGYPGLDGGDVGHLCCFDGSLAVRFHGSPMWGCGWLTV